MGTVEKQGQTYVFRQDDGEVTARFDSVDEKSVLAHQGDPRYRRVLNLLVPAGVLYLALIFLCV